MNKQQYNFITKIEERARFRKYNPRPDKLIKSIVDERVGNEIIKFLKENPDNDYIIKLTENEEKVLEHKIYEKYYVLRADIYELKKEG